MTLTDNLWLLLGCLLGIGGSCLIAYGADIVERLIRNRRASNAATSDIEHPTLEQWTVDK